MVIFTVATSSARNAAETIPDRLVYENSAGYLYIKIKTINNPDEYSLSANGFWLYFRTKDRKQGRDARQKFTNTANDDGKFEVFVLGLGNDLIEKKLFDKPGFETFTENDLFIIKIREELIKYKNCYAPDIDLYNNITGEWEYYRGY
jgi:hypothetical protein